MQTANRSHHDVVVVGARVAGSATAMLLARLGHDVVVVDQQESWEVDPMKFRSRSRNTPFAGWKVKGRVILTLVDGRVVYEAVSA